MLHPLHKHSELRRKWFILKQSPAEGMTKTVSCSSDKAMALKINLYYFLKCKLSRRLLIVIFTLMTLFSVTECATHPIEIRKEVGGNVTFPCMKDTKQPVKLMYLQNEEGFINGVHSSRNITKKWQNTRVDGTFVHMYNLEVKHEGNYFCYIMYNGNETLVTVPIHLQITAPYSKPSISKDYDDESHSYLVQCQSHNGYPSATLTWNILGSGSNSSQMWKSVNSSEVRSEVTLLFNISHTVVFHCSSGELNISCSVNGSTSEAFTICAAQVSPHAIYILIAACCVVGLLAIVVFLCVHCKKTRQSRTSAEDNTTIEMANNIEEGKPLNVTCPTS